MTDKIVVLSTCGSAAEAERLARLLIDSHLAACVNVIAPVKSFYRWKGVVENAEEWLLVIKTSRAHFDALRARLETAHSYELPEVLALPVVAGSPNYLSWLDTELATAPAPARPVRAFIFDMDGVLIDSNPAHCEAWAVYNRRHGVETTPDMHQIMYGKRNDQIIRLFLGDHLSDDEVFAHGAAKEALYRDMVQTRVDSLLVSGVRPFLERFSALPFAIATNAERANLDLVLRGAALAPYFPVAVDGQQVAHPKPAPDIYLRAAELLGIPPADCVVFEDSVAGVNSALAAGMRVIGLSTTHDELPGVSLLIRDFNDPALAAWFLANPPEPLEP